MEDHSCPRCGGPVESDLTCHTWPRTKDDGTVQWMSCLPCDSAVLYYCAGNEDADEDSDEYWGCGWRWTKGLNPQNPRSKENHKRYPGWYSEE